MYDIPITTLDRKKITLNDYVGKKPVYLKFWVSWCQPCREQMPHLQKTFEKYGDKIEVVTVNLGINDSLEEIKVIQKEFSLTAPIAIDNSGKLSQAFNMIGTPYHVLIDMKGNIIFKGNEASSQLDRTIKLLSASKASSLPKLSIEKTIAQSALVDVHEKKLTALFFTSTWCDWYLEESRPAISKNCIEGQKQANILYKDHPELNWIGIASRLWTGDKELKEYKNKYKIEYSLFIDISDQEFIKYKVKKFPSLILLQEGEEVFRTSNFSDSNKISSVIKNFQKKEEL
jgi:thiol-disulfide isomerase/thioredoxin